MDPKTARRVFIGGAAFLAVVVLGVAVQLNRRGPAEGTQGIQLSAPIPPRPESEVDDEDAERAPTDRLLVAKAPGDGDDVTFTEMLGLLKDGPRSAKTQAVADKFAADFKAQPRLKAVYDDYKRDAAAGKKPTAAAFMAKLRGTEGFKELVTRFAGMPGSGALMLQIAKQPRMETFLREDSARILGKPVARGRAAATLRGAGAIAAAARGSAAGARTAALVGDLKAGGGASAGAAGGRSTTQLASADVTGAGTQTGGAGAGSGIGGGSPGRADGAAGGAGASAGGPVSGGVVNTPTANPQTTPLGTILDATSARMAAFCADAKRQGFEICEGEPPVVMAPFRPLFDNLDLITQYGGVWGACFKLKIFANCMGACRGNACALPGGNAWAACLNAFDDDEAACIGYCGPQPPCRVPPVVWNRHCTRNPEPQGWAPPAYCTTEPQWAFPGCTGSVEVCYLYGRYLGRLPEKGGAIGWENEIRRLRSENPGISSPEILERLGPQFANSLEARLQAGEQGLDEERRRAQEEYDRAMREARITDAGADCANDVKCATESLIRAVFVEIYGEPPTPERLKEFLGAADKGTTGRDLEQLIRDGKKP